MRYVQDRLALRSHQYDYTRRQSAAHDNCHLDRELSFGLEGIVQPRLEIDKLVVVDQAS